MLVDRREGGGHAEDRKVTSSFLAAIEGVDRREGDGVWVFCTANIADKLDAAVLSRFGHANYIPLPGRIARRKMFRARFETLEEENIGTLARKSKGMSGRDIDTFCLKFHLSWRIQSHEETVDKEERLPAVTWSEVEPHLGKLQPLSSVVVDKSAVSRKRERSPSPPRTVMPVLYHHKQPRRDYTAADESTEVSIGDKLNLVGVDGAIHIATVVLVNQTPCLIRGVIETVLGVPTKKLRAWMSQQQPSSGRVWSLTHRQQQPLVDAKIMTKVTPRQTCIAIEALQDEFFMSYNGVQKAIKA